MKGSCLCGAVEFQVSPPFKMFQYCHCSRCRKFTGTAHASNLFVDPSQLTWTQGEDNVATFALPDTKYFGTAFCKTCGSSLPWQAQNVANVVIPAGTLDEDPECRPKHNIFWASKACWYDDPAHLEKHAELPPRKQKKS